MYRVLKKLGKGAFGVVYLLQTSEFEEYALKKTDASNVKEAKIMHGLCHPHLVKCYTYFIKRSTLYLLIEYCSQGSLKTYIDQQKHYISQKIVLRLLCQLADVLRYLYTQKIIHRDLKPDNIFLDEHRNVKVGDVGIARQLDFTSEEASSFTGTLLYMSPEVFEKKKYTAKADIWSLGCTMHEMMTLKRTFFSLGDMYRRNIPAFPKDIFCQPLQALVLQMLSEEADDRPDAYDLLRQTCEIRGKRYKPGDTETKVDIQVNPKEVCRALTCFNEESLSSINFFDGDSLPESHEKDAKSEGMTKDESDTVLENSSNSATATAKQFKNLQRDTFGSVPNARPTQSKKSKSNRKLLRGLVETDSLNSASTFSNDSTDNTLISGDTASNGLQSSHTNFIAGLAQEADEFFKEAYRHQDEVIWISDDDQSASNLDTSVTLYTRAQKAKYRNGTRQGSGDRSLTDLEKSTANVFSEQSDNLRELMMRRVKGQQSYKVGGQPMLSHHPF